MKQDQKISMCNYYIDYIDNNFNKKKNIYKRFGHSRVLFYKILMNAYMNEIVKGKCAYLRNDSWSNFRVSDHQTFSDSSFNLATRTGSQSSSERPCKR